MLGVGELDVVAVGGLDAIVVRLGTVVQRGQALQHLLHRLGERVVGAVHVGEQRVAAALGRHLGEVEDRAHRRLEVARHVGVPFLAGDVLRILVGLDHQDLGMLREGRSARWDGRAAARSGGRIPCAGRSSSSGRGRRSPGSPSARRALPGTAGCPAACRDRHRRSPPRWSASACALRSTDRPLLFPPFVQRYPRRRCPSPAKTVDAQDPGRGIICFPIQMGKCPVIRGDGVMGLAKP